jgi:hypothetical protein
MVIQERRGLTTHMAHTANRFADEGVRCTGSAWAEPPPKREGKRCRSCNYLSTGLRRAADYLLSRIEVVRRDSRSRWILRGSAFALQLSVQ